MANSPSVNFIRVSHHLKFNYSKMKDLQCEQYVSSNVFHALGNEWVIDCYPRGSRREWSGSVTSFLVRLHGKYKTVNQTISLSLMKRDGTTSLLSRHVIKRDGTRSFQYAVQKSPFEGQIFAYGHHFNALLAKDIVNNDSFELICTIDNTDIPSNRCSPGSSDLHSHIGKLLGCSETADATFRVENCSFVCHRLILAARSPVFKAMLFRNMAEATQQQIKIADMCPEVFEAMLHFIYTDSVPNCNTEMTSMKFTQHLFVAADRYAVEGLKALCEDKLCVRISLDNVMTTLALSLQHNSPRLKGACLDFILMPGTLVRWTLSDEYVDLVRSFPSVMTEIRGKVDTIPAFTNIN